MLWRQGKIFMKKDKDLVLALFKAGGGIVLFVALVFVLFWFVYRQSNALFFVFLPFFISLILAYLLSPVVGFMESRRISRTVAIGVIYVIFAMLVYIASVRFFPLLLDDLQELAGNLPNYARQAEMFLEKLQEDYRRFNLPPMLRDVIDENLRGLEQTLVSSLKNVSAFMVNIFNSLLIILLVPVLTFFLLRDEKKLKEWVVNLFPMRARTRFFQMVGEIDMAIGQYLRGMVVVSFLVGLIVYIGLLLLGVDFALFLGLFIAITNFIPFLGPIIGAVPAVIIAFLSSPLLALKVVILIVIIQQVESSLVAPLIFSRSLHFHPLVIILFLMLGGKLFGFLGLLLALPAAAVIRILGRHLLEVVPRYI